MTTYILSVMFLLFAILGSYTFLDILLEHGDATELTTIQCVGIKISLVSMIAFLALAIVCEAV